MLVILYIWNLKGGLKKMHNEKDNMCKEYKFIYENINNWINNIDNKISILLAFSAVILGFIVTCNSLYCYVVKINIIFELLMNLIILLLIISCFICMLSLIGRITTKINFKSNIFFGSIAKYDRKEFFENTEKMSIDNYSEDLKNQIYINSCICNKKVKLYNISLKLLMLAILISLLMFTIYIIK